MWGVVTGVAMVKSGLSAPAAAVMSLLVYAGSAQLTAIPLLVVGAPLWLIFGAGIIVNLRFLIFGAAMHPYFKHLPWPKRLLLGFMNVDIVFVTFMGRFGSTPQKGSTEQLWFFIGATIPCWAAWQLTSLVGITLSASVPSSWSLEFAAVLALMALMLPLIKTRPAIVSVLAAGVTAWLTQPWPLRIGLVASTVVGIAAGMLAESRVAKNTQSGGAQT
ncbi:MAG: AzlC family ABC transporter permease [Burkholderiaceae bacterium]|nr:AzlC family ABC transporter permease [Burkholderiaceae bacterium]